MEPSFAKRSLIYHRDYLINGRIVTSTAANITDAQVLTADGESIAYDYLVIATGHKDPVPKTRAERLELYKAGKQFPQFLRSKIIIIIRKYEHCLL